MAHSHDKCHHCRCYGSSQCPYVVGDNFRKMSVAKRNIVAHTHLSFLETMLPFTEPPKPTYHRHCPSQRWQRHTHKLERDCQMAFMGWDDHTVHQHQPQQHWVSWVGTNHHYFDGPPAVQKSFSGSEHQKACNPVWPPAQRQRCHNVRNQHHPCHRQPLQQSPPPPRLMVSLPRSQAPAIDRSTNATPGDFNAPPLLSSSASSHHQHHRQVLVPPPSHPLLHVVYDLHEADVLCGRGAPSNYHGGNRIFKDLVVQYQSSYLAARRHDKPNIAAAIVQHIHDRGGRFLKRVKMQGRGPSGHFCWQEIGQQRAYEKACQALREGAPELRRQLAAKEIAAAAMCLDRLNHHGATDLTLLPSSRSSDTTGTTTRTTTRRLSRPPQEETDDDDDDERDEAAEPFHDGCHRE